MMKNLNIYMNNDMLNEHIYRISKSSNAYSFFNCEYKNHAKDNEGNILLTIDEIYLYKNNRLSILHLLKSKILRSMKYRTVSKRSYEYGYFLSEYHHNIDKNSYNDIIVPMEENQKTYTK